MHIYEFGVVSDQGKAPPDGLRLIATDEMPIFSQFSFTLVDHGGLWLNKRLGSC